MAPILSGGESDETLDKCKYVRVGKQIVYSDATYDLHITLAHRYFPNVPENPDYHPIVADGGTIILFDGKLCFAGMPTTSCEIEGDVKKTREETKEVAQGILGKERVG